MTNDFEVGRVVSVDTAQVTIELNQDLKALTRLTYEGATAVAKINSYLILPIGAQRLVCMVTRVTLAEESEIRADRTMVSLPKARRVVKASLIGTLNGRDFTQGISNFPVLDNPVYLPGRNDLDLIFDREDANSSIGSALDEPGYCIEIGHSPIFDYPVKMNPDSFFGKHAAILGSTGSGKSCTIASIIQSILSYDGVNRTNFVILDTNGEYRSAFQQQQSDGLWTNCAKGRTLYIPSDPSISDEQLTIPYWFLNSEELARLFKASAGIQQPVLLESLRLARSHGRSESHPAVQREKLVLELSEILAATSRSGNVSKEVRDRAKGLSRWVEDALSDDCWSEIGTEIEKNEVVEAIAAVDQLADNHVDKNSRTGEEFPKVLPMDVRESITSRLEPIHQAIVSSSFQADDPENMMANPDSPIYFQKSLFRTQHIEDVLSREYSGGSRARDYSGTMLMRIDRLLTDSRFEFLFGPVGHELPNPNHSLAAFLRDVLGLGSADAPVPELSDPESVPEGALPFYDRQRAKTESHNVVIVDLSLLAAEVLENVSALIGRMVLEFLQRIGEVLGESGRGSLPVVLVLDEAQNYIADDRYSDRESISKLVFERIAREGRKYGLGLLLASQRPSELSKTAISQCSSFIVHRLQNPEDLRYFKEIVPGIYGPVLDQLSALAPQTALVLGECVRAPALVRILDADPMPRSKDPRFFRYWTADADDDIPVESIASRWEGRTDDPDMGVVDEPLETSSEGELLEQQLEGYNNPSDDDDSVV